MGGPGSGRGSKFDEKALNELMDESISIQLRFMRDENVPDEKKVQYAAMFITKKMVDKVNISIEHSIDKNQVEELYSRIKSQLATAQVQSIEYYPDPK